MHTKHSRLVSTLEGSQNYGPFVLSFHLKAALTHPAFWISLGLIFNVLEGALRKWVPGFESAIGRGSAYFSKDVCFFIGAFLVFNASVRYLPAIEMMRQWAGPALALIAAGGLMSATSEFNAMGSVLSLRALLILPLLGYCYCTRVGNFPLLGFALIAVLLTLINAPLSLVQNGLPASHVLNQYANNQLSVVEVASGVRATGTFSYLAGLGVVSALGVWAGMILISVGGGWKLDVAGGVGIFAGLACAAASGSRGTLVIAVTMLAIWGISSIKASRMLLKASFLAAGVGVLILYFAPSIGERFIISGEGVLNRFEDAGDSNVSRAFGQWGEMWYAVTNHPMGTGLGTEQVVASVTRTGTLGFNQYESQFPRIVAEFGIVGFLGFLILISAVIIGLQRLKAGGNRSWAMIVTATQVFALGQFYGSLVYNHTASAMSWLVVTAVFAATPIADDPEQA